MMDPAHDRPSPEVPEDRETADAAWLVRDNDRTPEAPVEPAPAPTAADQSYDVLGPETGEADSTAESQVVPPIPDPPVRAPKPRAARQTEPASASTIDRVWTRWDEWGTDILRLVAAGAGILLVVYLSFAAGLYSLAFLAFLFGGLAMTALAYPVLITLERPVRIVPEQALKDYYGSLSHAFPHYRRMWLLLSSSGRDSTHFKTFEAFRAYWNEKLASLSGADAGRVNRLIFTVAEFQSERSSGLTVVDVKFTLNVASSKRAHHPIASYPVEMSLVKGPDRMWYLDTGTLPGGRG